MTTTIDILFIVLIMALLISGVVAIIIFEKNMKKREDRRALLNKQINQLLKDYESKSNTRLPNQRED